MENISRKDFIRYFFKSFTPDNGATSTEVKSTDPLLPPGAAESADYLKHCNQCYQCVSACEKEAIRVYRGDHHDKLYGYPVIEARRQPCYMCPDFPCIEACTTQALKKERAASGLGVAVIDKNLCFAYNDHFCQSCISNCMYQDKAIKLNKQNKPEINLEHCNGCGHCAYSCPAQPPAIQIIRQGEV